jgi:dTDP-4-dehydrorhamnose 3,5-epimerase
MLRVTETTIPGVRILVPATFRDERGTFSETYSRRRFVAAGVTADWVQENQALSRSAGTIRGLHFQVPPFAQAKLVRVVRGALLDVAVDLRRGSPTFGQHVAIELRARDGRQLMIPAGFAHGYCTLAPDTEILYKVDAYYSPDHERGIRWDDPGLAIPWPVPPDRAVLSGKDRGLPLLEDVDLDFHFEVEGA